MSSPEVGLRVVHRRYVSHADAHYGGSLVDGAFSLALFGDVATELCIRTDGDEGLFAGYADVAFHEAVRAGDVLEVSAELVRVGRRSREVAFEARVVCRAEPERSASASRVLPHPLLATAARGTVVVPAAEHLADAPVQVPDRAAEHVPEQAPVPGHASDRAAGA